MFVKEVKGVVHNLLHAKMREFGTFMSYISCHTKLVPLPLSLKREVIYEGPLNNS